jgi:hypothetical protein
MNSPLRSTAVAALLGATMLAVTAVGSQPASAQPAPSGPAPEAALTNTGGLFRPAVAGFADAPAPVRDDAFELGTNHRVVHWLFENHNLAGREDLGGAGTSGVAAARTVASLQVVLVRGTDAAVWFRLRVGTNPWVGWRSLGGRITDSPTAAQVGGMIVVAVRGIDGFMYERVWSTSGWSARWRQVSSALIGSPAVGAAPHGGFVAYVHGRDGRLWMATRGGSPSNGWSAWKIMPNPPGTEFVPADPGVDVTGGAMYARGADGACWRFQAFDFSGWHSLGGQFDFSGFAAITQSGGTGAALTTVYGRSPTGLLYRQVGGGPWRRVGG